MKEECLICCIEQCHHIEKSFINRAVENSFALDADIFYLDNTAPIAMLPSLVVWKKPIKDYSRELTNIMTQKQ